MRYGNHESQTQKNDCGFANRTKNPQHNCPARNVKCNNCQIMRHWARYAETNHQYTRRKRNYLDETQRNKKANWRKLSHNTNQQDKADAYGIVLEINRNKQNFIIDTSVPVTIMLNNTCLN